MSRRKAIKILQELEFIVVSLEHIGSMPLSKRAREREIYDFMIESNVFERLATMRKLISVAIDKTISGEEQRAIESTLEKVKMWHVKQAKSS